MISIFLISETILSKLEAKNFIMELNKLKDVIYTNLVILYFSMN